jgi:Holliday junction resolvase RusA-like endonuclease
MRAIDWRLAAEVFAQSMAAESGGRFRMHWGFADVNAKGEPSCLPRQVAVGFFDRHSFAGDLVDRRDTIHAKVVALLEQRGLRELARAASGDTVAILFEGTLRGRLRAARRVRRDPRRLRRYPPWDGVSVSASPSRRVDVSAVLAFVVPGPPQPKERPRVGRRGHVYTPRRTSSYEATVRAHALAAVGRAAWRRVPGARYSVTLDVYFPDARRRDLDNACKSILDACNGVAFADDSEVDELHVVRAVDRARPRVEVSVRRRARRVGADYT